MTNWFWALVALNIVTVVIAQYYRCQLVWLDEQLEKIYLELVDQTAGSDE